MIPTWRWEHCWPAGKRFRSATVQSGMLYKIPVWSVTYVQQTELLGCHIAYGSRSLTCFWVTSLLGSRRVCCISCCRSQHKEAAKSFQRAVAAAPGDVRPLFRLGNALFAAHQIHDSQEAFQQALACASLPDDAALLPKIHVNLGISLEAGGQLQVACQHYRCDAI